MNNPSKLELNEEYAVCWTDDPTVRIMRYRGVKRGFIVFEDEDGTEFLCRGSSVIIRQLLR